jgi:hypothetical protein
LLLAGTVATTNPGESGLAICSGEEMETVFGKIDGIYCDEIWDLLGYDMSTLG